MYSQFKTGTCTYVATTVPDISVSVVTTYVGRLTSTVNFGSTGK